MGFSVFFLLLLLSSTEGFSQRPAPERESIPEPETQAETKETKGGKILKKDSTSLYGPTTAHYITEADLMKLNTKGRTLDTSIINFQRYNYVARENFLYQDIGTVGTAIQPIFDRRPNRIGPRLGIRTIRPYEWEADEINYYDTYSPVSDWWYRQGHEGKAILTVNMNQNIKPNWNVGLVYHRISSRLLVGNESRRRDQFQVQNSTYLIHTRYQTPNNRYRFLWHVYAYTHEVLETGGVDIEQLVAENAQIEIREDVFGLGAGAFTNRLEGGTNSYPKAYHRKNRLYFYQEYSLVDSASFQLFHSFERTSYKFNYADANYGSNLEDFYSFFAPQSSSADPIWSQVLHDRIQHRTGVKGKVLGLTAAGWFKQENHFLQYNYEYETKIPANIPSQSYVGAQVYYQSPDSTFSVLGKGEAIVNASDYEVEVRFESKWGDASYETGNYSPAYLRRFYQNQLFNWQREEQDMTYSRLRIAPKIQLNPRMEVSPFIEHYEVGNYSYYDTLARPRQLSGKFNYLISGVQFNFKNWYIRQIGRIQYLENNSQTGALRMPSWLVNYQIMFEKRVFTEALFIQLGFDFHWHEAYYSDAYMPVTQQFHNQNIQRLGNYLYADFFLNFRLNRARMYIKMVNVFQGVISDGFFSSPDYMGVGRGIEYGVRWYLFD